MQYRPRARTLDQPRGGILQRRCRADPEARNRPGADSGRHADRVVACRGRWRARIGLAPAAGPRASGSELLAEGQSQLRAVAEAREGVVVELQRPRSEEHTSELQSTS